jgi:hypothetical protein
VQGSSVRDMAVAGTGTTDLVVLSDWDKSGRLGPDKRAGAYRQLAGRRSPSGAATAVLQLQSLSRLAPVRWAEPSARLIDDAARLAGFPVRPSTTPTHVRTRPPPRDGS